MTFNTNNLILKVFLLCIIVSFPLLLYSQTGVYVQNGKNIDDVKETMRFMAKEVVYDKQEIIDKIASDGKPLFLIMLYYIDRKTGYPIIYEFNKQRICYNSQLPISKNDEDILIEELDKNFTRIDSNSQYTAWIWGYGSLTLIRYLNKPYYTLQYLGIQN
jgi:hypothetical protein